MKWLNRLVLFLSIGSLVLVNCDSTKAKDFEAKTIDPISVTVAQTSSTIVNSLPTASVPSTQEDIFLDQLASRTWAYLHSDATTANHMPSSWYVSTESVGNYANTAEIGFYALAWVAAYDLKRSWSPDWQTTEAEVNATLDQLRLWQTDGTNTYAQNEKNVFYQWYWIANSPPTVGGNADPDHIVPSIDNAWLAASLITIREYAEANGHPAMAQKANAILADMDFALWYHADTHRFSWGAVENPQGGMQADYYSNENRIINFVTRALGQLTQEEFHLSLGLDALNKPSGTYNGITVDRMAWDGSYFTYAGPALFIREMDTPYGQDTITPALQAQIQYAADQGYAAWGLSDSYDTTGNYVQQGAPPVPVGMTAPIETVSGLVTPHASSMGLITPLAARSIANLQNIKTTFPTCFDANYGFRDSVIARSGTDYGTCSDRFTSLAQEWLFLSIVNHDSGFIWKYFYRDENVVSAHAEMYDPTWTLIWQDEFNINGGINPTHWICDSGTSYPGGPSHWGTGEIESYSCGADNLFQDSGSLHIRALHTGADPLTGWTSGRIETVRSDFQPPSTGTIAVEARIKLPEVTSAQGYWPAFWMLGEPYRDDYSNWPGNGEIDIMENINGLNQWWGTFHCGTNPGGPCNETNGLGGTAPDIVPEMQSTFHIYRVELDRSRSPQELRWYVDGIKRFNLASNQFDPITWDSATKHGFFILLNVAMGGGWAGNPTENTLSGGTMLVDYVRVYSLGIPEIHSISRTLSNPTSAQYLYFTVVFSEPVIGVDVADFALTKTGALINAFITSVNGTGTTYTVTIRTGTGNGTLRLDVPDTATISDVTGNPLTGLPFTSGEVYTVQRLQTLLSQGAQDGWILESGENANAGGTMDSAATILRLGDNATRKQYRSILSFDTSSLPDTAVITKVTLKVRRQGITGRGNPVATFQGFMVDIRKGLFGTASLQLTDWQAAANKTVGPFSATPVSGWYMLDLTGAKAYINKLTTSGGLTQIRLRFKLEDNNDAVANVLSLYSGNAGTTNRPQLQLEYYIP